MTSVKEISLPSRIESVEEAATIADEFAKSNGFSEEVIFAVDLAIRESVANAVKHGNRFAEDKPVEVTLADTDSGLEILVRDHGAGFDLGEIPDPTDPDNILKTNGRGILFMRTFMDEVEWTNPTEGGLAVKMVKKRQ